MRALINFALLIGAFVLSTAAAAGLRATYAVGWSRPQVIQIADNGEFDAELGSGRRVIAKGGETYLVEERLTGPIVTRVADLAAVAASRSRQGANPPQAAEPIGIVERGTFEVNGRTGRAFFSTAPIEEAGRVPEPLAVISDDPVLAGLGPVVRSLSEIEILLQRIRGDFPPEVLGDSRTLLDLLDRGSPLRLGSLTLRSIERLPIAPETISLPGPPETGAALAARLADEARENEGGDFVPISRAAFGAGRLWLLTDTHGSLWSLAEGEAARTVERPGGPVLDICAWADSVIAVTGRRDGGAVWTVRRFEDGEWRTVRTVNRANDHLLALSCGAAGEMLLTSRRLVDLARPDRQPLRLSRQIRGGLVTTVLHVTPQAAFVGINKGEWGGGLRRIDRRTGRVETIERNATGELCDGPLNTDCDPVHAIVTVPWRPDCVAAAVGLMHMLAHGRIVQVCPGGVEQLFAALADVDPDDPREAAEARAGGHGSAAFYGLAERGGTLVAASHDGLYRIAADGSFLHQRWPRFVEIDGLLVSFAMPDIVLVVTQINGRAALSGATPLLVPR